MTLDIKPQPIEVGRSWSVYPGYLYGLRQPVMSGRLAISAGLEPNLGAIDTAIAALADDLPYEPPAIRGTEGIARRIAHLVIALQSYCEIPVSDAYHVTSAGSAADGSADFRVVMPYYELKASRMAMLWLAQFFNRLLDPVAASGAQPGRDDFRELEVKLRKYALPSRNVQHFIKAAFALDIPVTWLVGNVFSFGTGCHTRLMDSTVTERTSQLGAKIARNKAQTAALFRKAGLPASRQKLVSTEDEATSAAESLGYPVVVKPIDKDQGLGVFAGLREAGAVHEAAGEALKFSQPIIVEKHFHGNDFRLTVVEGTVVKVENRIAGGVVGDGQSTVAELVARKQASPRFQRILRASGKIPLSLDGEAGGLLEELGLSGDSVPENGRYLALRRKNNVSTGGEQVAIPVEQVHPDNLALAIRAAALLRLDIAGVDLIISDIRRSWLDTGALICEVNAVPQVGIRTTPNIYGDILRQLLGPVARIPAHLVVTPEDQQPTVTGLADMMARLSCNGVSLAREVWIDGDRLAAKPADAFSSARILLGEQTTRGALCVVPESEIVKNGLPSDWFDSIRLQARGSELNALLPAIRLHTASLIEMADTA